MINFVFLTYDVKNVRNKSERYIYKERERKNERKKKSTSCLLTV